MITQATRVDAPVTASNETVRLTVPPPSELSKTILSGSNLVASRRTSLLANLSQQTAGPLPDRYQEGRVLGKGGMGVVVLAEDRDLARPVAVKKLHAEAKAPDQIDRFLKEAQVTAQLEHPGILPVHDLGVDELGQFFYVMRLVKGDETLRRVIDRLKAGDDATHAEFTFERRVEIMQQLARILHYVHSRGVVHRDLKPENIMLGSFGEVYIVDWGLAKVTGASGEGVSLAGMAGGAGTTQAGSIVGTPLYMAPEQTLAEPATPSSDIYALSAVLYEFLSLHHYLGEIPKGETIEQLLARVRDASHVRADAHYCPKNGRVPPHLMLACMKGLSKDPRARFASAKELERALQNWVEGAGPAVCPVTLQLRAMTLYKRLLVRHPRVVGFFTVTLPVLLLIAFVIFKLVTTKTG